MDPESEKNRFIMSRNGIQLELFPHEYWYLAPSRTTFAPGDSIRPLDFAIVLHNARLSRGVMTALDDLLSGIPPSTLRNGASRDAELLLEKVRSEHYPEKPSRLRSYFLNYSKHVAEIRQNAMFRGDRKLVRCQVILNSGRFHHGDVEIFERLSGRPDDTKLAVNYWQNFNPANEEEFDRLEVIADSMLYFPDWEEFPILDKQVLIAWQKLKLSSV